MERSSERRYILFMLSLLYFGQTSSMGGRLHQIGGAATQYANGTIYQ